MHIHNIFFTRTGSTLKEDHYCNVKIVDLSYITEIKKKENHVFSSNY